MTHAAQDGGARFVPASDAANVPLAQSRRAPAGAPGFTPARPARAATPVDAPDPKALQSLAQFVSVTAALAGLAGTVAGIVLCLMTDNLGTDLEPITVHPYTGIGVGLIVAGVLAAPPIVMLAQWAKMHAAVTYLEYLAPSE